jgi:DNA modification methylase
VKPYISDPDFTLYLGDALEVLRELPDESVDCCVTSPPYWGLRDYGTAAWKGGDADCAHLAPSPGGTKASGLARPGDNRLTQEHLEAKVGQRRQQYRDECRHCGARRVDSQLGLEPTADAFVAALAALFGEVRRVLASSGSLWLNLGDSYTPEKRLSGTPWLVALALQAQGWHLRSCVIWHKPDPMPESVTDRPTTAHEYVFLLTKSTHYFYDALAIAERAQYIGPNGPPRKGPYTSQMGARAGVKPQEGEELWRNARSVWTIGTGRYPDAHFAVFPEELPRRCILAGCPVGGTVLDPFMGAGTTALVARKHGRKSIGIELNPEYAALAARRLSQLSLLAEAT